MGRPVLAAVLRKAVPFVNFFPGCAGRPWSYRLRLSGPPPIESIGASGGARMPRHNQSVRTFCGSMAMSLTPVSSFDLQHLRPCLPAIRRLVNSALRIRAPQMSQKLLRTTTSGFFGLNSRFARCAASPPAPFSSRSSPTVERLVRPVAPWTSSAGLFRLGPVPTHTTAGSDGRDGDVADWSRHSPYSKYSVSQVVAVCSLFSITPARGCAHVHDVGVALHHCEIINAPAPSSREPMRFAEIPDF